MGRGQVHHSAPAVDSRPRAAEFARTYLGALARCAGRLPLDDVAALIGLIEATHRGGGQLFVVGNGGSAATASHLACDLAKNTTAPLAPPGQRLRVHPLTDHVAWMTAVANDLGYERLFAEQVLTLARPGDLVLAISGSGRSANIVAALEAARAVGARTAALLGGDGGAALPLVDVAVVVPSRDYGHIEDLHLAVGHLIAAWFRERLEAAGDAVTP